MYELFFTAGRQDRHADADTHVFVIVSLDCKLPQQASNVLTPRRLCLPNCQFLGFVLYKQAALNHFQQYFFDSEFIMRMFMMKAKDEVNA